MFLEKYVQELDQQLARLIAARDTIAALAGSPSQSALSIGLPTVAPTAAAPAAVAETAPVALEASGAVAPDVALAPLKRRGRPRGSKNKTVRVRMPRYAAFEPRALSSTVPVGPVVISPAQLAKRREPVAPAPVVAAPAHKPEPPNGGLDALIRELSERRVAAFSPAA